MVLNLTWGGNTPHTQRLLGELVLYISQKTADLPSFGAIKLNKTLYHADMNAFKKRGKAITGAQYQRLDNGPTARHLLPVEKSLIEAGALKVHSPDDRGHKRREALRDPVLSDFSEEQLKEVDRQIDRLSQMSTQDVIEDSHDVRWSATRDRAGIPYEYVFISGIASKQDKVDAKFYAEQFGW